ncbi:MAG: SMP-30/gluconolactonase/LRE family protein [Gordonia sp. (in: high G+C Gram-positive bacteria)]|uniref:SMP-30/gluconolactonase/LRE family protein n=1 Tax=Gordonia sp. (in: high G+C Gram-positive bacteria) TaxID=84139 RepID=UPI003C71F594
MSNLPFEIVTTGLLFPEGPVVLPNGDVLTVEIHRGTLTRVSPDGTRTIVAELGGGPNGAAIGPDGRVYIANSGGQNRIMVGEYAFSGGIPDDYVTGSLQAVDLTTGEVETLYTECDGRPLRGPNDIVFDAHGGCYITDYGKSDGVTSDRGRVFYCKADGSGITLIASDMNNPNGIGLSPDGSRLYVSETLTATVWWWDVEGPGQIKGGRTLAGSGGANYLWGSPDWRSFDSLGVEANGNICVASLATPGIMVISPEGETVEFVEIDTDGDPGITNICWGGDDMKTAYVTASCTGKLLKFAWPRPGTELNYQGLAK